MEALVFCDDTVQELGLKYLLDKFFDIPVTVVHDVAEVDVSTVTRDMLLVATPKCVVLAIDFFMPRRSQTVLLVSGALPGSEYPVANVTADESSLIEIFRGVIERLRRVRDNEVRGAGLSQREVDVLRLVALGYINKEIADELSISINTVLSHRKNIIAKLGIRSASGWSFYAMMNGLIDSSQLRR